MALRRFSWAAPAVLLFVSIIVALLVTVIVDRCAGLFMGVENDLVFDRYSIVSYSTPEFQIKARINNLGYRGENLDPRKRKQYRIATLGDSFTFGWGVDDEDTWPRVLEKNLRNRGLDVEVMNLGQPGTWPAQYAEIAERALPVLRPDLVVVAVNPGDDLGQIMRAATTSHKGESGRTAWSAIKAVLKSLYPNLLELKRRVSSPKSEMSATAGWKEQVADLLPHLSPEENRKLDRIDGEIKGMFVRGELNPGLLVASLRRPDYIWKTLDLDNPLVQKGIQEMSKELSRIKVSAEGAGGKIVVVSLPNGFFVSKRILETNGRIGFIVDPSCLTTTSMDDAIRMATSKPGIDFLEVTQTFREESMKRNLFFRFDGHYNREGQRYFAESIGPFIGAKLRVVDR
ncbi:MAG: hypothetical protein WA373_03865 [Burkholderiales bacterium]